MATRAEVLMDARDLISDPAHWTRGDSATNDRGHTKSPYAPDATKFCAQGAVRRCAKKEIVAAIGLLAILDRAAWMQGNTTHVLVNDELGHEAVMQMFDDAIRIAKEKDL